MNPFDHLGTFEKRSFRIICILLVLAWFAGRANAANYVIPHAVDLGQTINNATYIKNNSYRFWLVPAGKMPSTGTIKVYNTAPDPDILLFQRTVNADGTTNENWTFPFDLQLGNISMDGANGAPTSRTFSIAITTTWAGGQNLDLMFSDTFTRSNWYRESDPRFATGAGPFFGASSNKVLTRTLVVKGPGFENGQWNVEIRTRSRLTLGVDYMLKWADDSLGQIQSVRAANPPSPALLHYARQELVAEGETPAKTATVWRRIQGGGWQQIWTGSVAYGTTQPINDYFEEQLPEQEGGDEPPEQAVAGGGGFQGGAGPQQGGNGATGGTDGDGFNTGGTGISGGGTGGSGGGGIDGLTQAEVQAAVRGGVNQAADDSTANLAPTMSTGGLGLDDTTGDNAGTDLQDVRAAHGTIATTLGDSGPTAFASRASAVWPTVGSGSLSRSFTLPMLGAVNVNLAPYSSTITVIRALCLAVLTLAFFFLNLRVVRSAIG